MCVCEYVFIWYSQSYDYDVLFSELNAMKLMQALSKFYVYISFVGWWV